jgi:hypothetical protein
MINSLRKKSLIIFLPVVDQTVEISLGSIIHNDAKILTLFKENKLNMKVFFKKDPSRKDSRYLMMKGCDNFWRIVISL